jgi:hypothetical protein
MCGRVELKLQYPQGSVIKMPESRTLSVLQDESCSLWVMAAEDAFNYLSYESSKRLRAPHTPWARPARTQAYYALCSLGLNKTRRRVGL